MADPPFVSVVVPAYNAARTLGECIQSLLELDFPRDHLEILIVDNGSHDETVRIAESFAGKFPFLRVLAETRILNAYGARNCAARQARGEIVAFTDADCVADRQWLTELLKGWDDSGIGCFVGDIHVHSPKSVVERYYSRQKRLSVTRVKQPGSIVGMNAGNCAIRKKCLQEAGYFDASLPAKGDIDFVIRLQSNASYRILVNPSAVVFHKERTSLLAVFKRGLRDGSDVAKFRYSGMFPTRWPNGTTSIGRLLILMASFCKRLLLFPFSSRRKDFALGGDIDNRVYLISPLVQLAEESGVLGGRVLKLSRFR